MTYKEQWELMHPNQHFNPRGSGCPADLVRSNCSHIPSCEECWDREIPEEEAEVLTFEYGSEGGIKVRQVIVTEDGAYATADIPTIKDSGDRTEFETGAVRDMREGKGRCDLMPLEVVANYICDSNTSSDTIILNLKRFLQTNSTSYLYSALDTFDVMRWDCAYTMMLEVAKHFEDGAKKYGENNWQKGIPVHCYIDSAIRHYLKWLRGDKDEPHDRAFVWNLMCCIWEVDYREKKEETQ